MKAFIHIGLHKTGTTYLQHLANENHEDLLRSGIYYDPMEGYPAHHGAAWQLLRGNPTQFRMMAERGKQAGARTLLMSSEDLEALIFRPRLATRLIKALKKTGVEGISFVIYIRRQDSLFWSHFSELSKHLYIDPLHMLNDVLRLGYFFVENPKCGRNGTPYWYFCFDHKNYISRFRDYLTSEALPTDILLFKFDKFGGFPGDEMFEALGAQQCLKKKPNQDAKNVRLLPEEISENYGKQFIQTFGLGHQFTLLVEHRANVSPTARKVISQALIDRFDDGGEFSCT